MNKHILSLASADPSLVDLIGNKSAGLIQLRNAGFQVPDGVCLSTLVFSQWRAEGKMNADMEDEIIKAISHLRRPVAVRSSSPAEDREDASFAGQYQTILGVNSDEEIIEAICECWQSVDSEAVSAYRNQHSDDAKAEMAVLIQELVPATTSGVLFTMHPVSEQPDQVVIEANFGLGEAVVSGLTEPDSFVVNKKTGSIVERKIGSKRVQSELTNSGVQTRPTAEIQRGKVCLSEEQVSQLQVAACHLESYFDLPMDAEWALENNSLYMLQARPVTTGLAEYYTYKLDQWAFDRKLTHNPETVWRRGSPLSSLPASPLYYSEMSAFFSDMFPEIAKLHGGVSPSRKEFRYFKGYTYTNNEFASTADPSGEVQPIGISSPQWKSNLRLALSHPRSLAFWTNIKSYYSKWNNKWYPEIDRRRPDYDNSSPDEIRTYIEFLEKQRRERSIYAACAVGYAGDYLGLLQHLLNEWVSDVGEEALGILTSGLEGSLTHDENLEVWNIAKAVDNDTALKNALLDNDTGALNNLPGAEPFLSSVDALRKHRPHRGCSDRDLMQPRWGDSRDSLLSQVANMLRAGEKANPQTAHGKAAARRVELENNIREKLADKRASFLKRCIFNVVLRETQLYWVHRDNQRHQFDVYFYELRKAYLAIGKELAAKQLLEAPDDIFFSGKNEIYDTIDGKLTPERFRKRTLWRRQWWHNITQSSPPPLFLQGNQPWQDPAVSDGGDADLVGSGGAPGVVRGSVKLVRGLNELTNLKDGDIVVTHAIDPAWTPIFGTISGVISEEGGMLSHATVLGREYGLPVVIGATGATDFLEEGEFIEINGTSGSIKRLDAEKTKSLKVDA